MVSFVPKRPDMVSLQSGMGCGTAFLAGYLAEVVPDVADRTAGLLGPLAA